MPSRPLFMIRLAMLIGVLAFGAVSFYLRSRAPIGAEDVARLPLDALRYALWGVSAGAVLAALYLRTRLEPSPPPMRRSITIIGWAFGEGAALFGIVQHFMGGAASTAAVGVLAFIVVLTLLPVPHEPVTTG